MDSQKFIDKCKEIVSNYANKHLDKSDQKEIIEKDVFDAYKKWENKAIKV